MTAVEPKPRLDGVEIAITGRLASMTRPEAVASIERAGGGYVATPGEGTDLLVVGEGGPQLGEGGRTTRKLRAARELVDAGAPLAIVGEAELLSRLAADEPGELARLHTVAQLARLVGVPTGRVHRWVRSDLLRPIRREGRLGFFGFREVTWARALAQLEEGGVGPAAVRRGLAQLSLWPSAGGRGRARAAELEPADDGALVLRTALGVAEPSGQLRLDFDPDGEDAGATVTALFEHAPAKLGAPTDHGSGDWFARGVHAERAGRLRDAADCYERAALTDPTPDAVFNLGNARYALGERERAATCFRRAVALDPEFVDAWNNLGNALADGGRAEEAVRAFRRALALAPSYADAHFNLAETLLSVGRRDEAVPHWRAYLALDPESEWAETARARLRDA